MLFPRDPEPNVIPIGAAGLALIGFAGVVVAPVFRWLYQAATK